MVFLLGFILGLIVGVGMFLGYGYVQVVKIKKVKQGLIDQIKTKAQEMQSKESTIKDRLIKASEIAQTQMTLRQQMDQPSKNALHSKYKNGIVSELHDLERQKLDLLRTVLAEGFDPSITVISESGVKEQMLLSKYVNEAANAIGDSIPPKPTDDSAKRAGKFVVYKGGKDDGTTH
jgi:hypothetical protein